MRLEGSAVLTTLGRYVPAVYIAGTYMEVNFNDCRKDRGYGSRIAVEL
jgi:hypothetical protein